MLTHAMRSHCTRSRAPPYQPPNPWDPAPPCLPRLSPLYPETLMVGMELRDKVSLYVKERIGEHICCAWVYGGATGFD